MIPVALAVVLATALGVIGEHRTRLAVPASRAVLGLMLDALVPQAYLLQAAMPSAVNGLVVGHAYGLDLKLITTTIVWSTMIVLAIGLVMTVL